MEFLPAEQNTVELLGHYGGDESHALSAWTSTRRELDDDRRQRMGQLLAMLAQQGHHTPFEKSYLQFLVTCDTASHIHLLKHRVGVNINSESARYKEHRENKYYLVEDWPDDLRLRLEDYSQLGFRLYHDTLNELVGERGFTRKRAKESARYFLPYTGQLTLDVAFNFRSFMHFQKLRNHEDAQLEIREIAQKMLGLVEALGDFDLSLAGFGY